MGNMDTYKNEEETATMKEIVLRLAERIEALEKIVGTSVVTIRENTPVAELEAKPPILSADYAEEHDSVDTNEFGANTFDTIGEVTVSPSNYEKINRLKYGESIKIFCTNNRKVGIVLKNVGEIVSLNNDPEVEHDNDASRRSNKKRNQTTKRRKKPYNISTTKNVFPSAREKAIASGVIIPATKNHAPQNRRAAARRWKSKF